MQHLVDSYHDEWAEVVKDPVRRQKFKQLCMIVLGRCVVIERLPNFFPSQEKAQDALPVWLSATAQLAKCEI